MEKRVHELKAGDIVKVYNCHFEVIEDAKESRGHFQGMGPSPVAYAKAVCVKGERGNFSIGTKFSFQGNFLANTETVIN